MFPRASSFAVGLILFFSSPGAASPPGGLDRFCCLHPQPSGQVLFLDAAAAELWQWDGSQWKKSAQLPPLPCTPTAFATDPSVRQVAVACHERNAASPGVIFDTSLANGATEGWRRLPPLPLATVASVAFYRASWEVAGHPCRGEAGNCGEGRWRSPANSTFPAWVRWEENRWKTRRTASWDPQWQEVVDDACKRAQLSHRRPCQRYPLLEWMLQDVVAHYGFLAKSYVLAANASGKLWAGPADGERFELLGETAEAFQVLVSQGPPPFAEVETPVSFREPRRPAFGPVQGTIRHQVPVRRYLAAAALGERLYLLRKGERWELVACEPGATWTVPLPTSYELCPPGSFPGFYGRCQLAVGKTFVVVGPPWVVLALPEGWDRKPAEPQ